jgi:hypothetical protein
MKLDDATWAKIEGWIAEAGGALNEDSEFREHLEMWSGYLHRDNQALEAKERQEALEVADALRSLEDAMDKVQLLHLKCFLYQERARFYAAGMNLPDDSPLNRFRKQIGNFRESLERWLHLTAPEASRPRDLDTAIWVEGVAFKLEAESGIPLRDGRGRTSHVAITLLCRLWSETVPLNHGRADNRRAIQRHLKIALDERDRERNPGAKKLDAGE